jgi:hypothetical protein
VEARNNMALGRPMVATPPVEVEVTTEVIRESTSIRFLAAQQGRVVAPPAAANKEEARSAAPPAAAMKEEARPAAPTVAVPADWQTAALCSK